MSQNNVMALVRAHGRSAASFQSTTSGLRHWFGGPGDSCVAYADVGGAWVAVGSGLAPASRELENMESFVQAGRARRKRVRFFATEETLPEGSGLSTLQVGEMPVWDPRSWPGSLSTRMRAQLRRDQKHARVQVRQATYAEVVDPRSPTRQGIDAVIANWLDTRRVAPMGFMVDVAPWHLAHERRFFVAEEHGNVVAALIAIPVCAREGWFLETMLRAPGAPNGTVELLFDLAMRTFASEGCSYVTFGMCPLSNVSSRTLQWLRRLSSRFYNYEGLRKFKGKLAPASWQPLYLAYPKGDSALSALWDAGRAFLPGGVLSFAWNSAIQAARPVCRFLAYSTMLWVSAFAFLAQDHWFPSTRAKLARIGLDVLLMIGFLLLGERFWRPRALAVGALAMGTFLVSCLQLTSGGSAQGWMEWAVITIGTLGPLASALFLFAASGREHRYAIESRVNANEGSFSLDPEPRH